MADGWTGRRCPGCRGNGRRITDHDEVIDCPDCAGTGEEWGEVPDDAPDIVIIQEPP